jgi:SnoaL-like domain
MSERDLALVHRAVVAFNEQGANLEGMPPARPDLYASEPEIVPFRAALEGIVYSGPRAIEEFWAASRESWSELHIEPDRMEPVGDGVLAVGTLTGTSRETGAKVEARVAFACHVRDGRIARLASHMSEEDARRELEAD